MCYCSASQFSFPTHGDMLGIGLFHLLNETYLLPQIMYLFSSASRADCLQEKSFQWLLEGKFGNPYRGSNPSFRCLCGWIKWSGVATALFWKGCWFPRFLWHLRELLAAFSYNRKAMFMAMFTHCIILEEASITPRDSWLKNWEPFGSDNNCQRD